MNLHVMHVLVHTSQSLSEIQMALEFIKDNKPISVVWAVSMIRDFNIKGESEKWHKINACWLSSQDKKLLLMACDRFIRC